MTIGVGFTRLGLIGIPRGEYGLDAFAGKVEATVQPAPAVRLLSIESESRMLAIDADNRAIGIEPDDRTLTVH